MAGIAAVGEGEAVLLLFDQLSCYNNDIIFHRETTNTSAGAAHLIDRT